jgi:beta-fructofuranosidase
MARGAVSSGAGSGSNAAQKAAGWAGVMSLPRVLSLRPNGALGIQPAAEFAKLRGKASRTGNSIEIIARLDPVSGLEVSGVRILYDRASQELRAAVADRSHAGHLPLAPGEPLDLHLFLDGSVLEIFANGRAALTARVYGVRPEHVKILPIGPAKPLRLDSWEVQAVSPDRLTSWSAGRSRNQ